MDIQQKVFFSLLRSDVQYFIDRIHYFDILLLDVFLLVFSGEATLLITNVRVCVRL